MSEHKKGTRHSLEVIEKIIDLFDNGMRAKSISLQSKKLIGYRIHQSTISEILRREGKNPKDNTYRLHRKRKIEEDKIIRDLEVQPTSLRELEDSEFL